VFRKRLCNFLFRVTFCYADNSPFKRHVNVSLTGSRYIAFSILVLFSGISGLYSSARRPFVFHLRSCSSPVLPLKLKDRSIKRNVAISGHVYFESSYATLVLYKFLFIYDLFNGAFSSSNCTECNNKMGSARCVIKYVEGSSHCQEGLRKPRKTSVRTVRLWTEI
jgi:hypothetical protein